MATITPFTWIRTGLDVSVDMGIPGSMQEEIYTGKYGDNFDIVATFGRDTGPAAGAFDPNPFVYSPNNVNLLMPALTNSYIPVFNGRVQGGFDSPRGDLIRHANNQNGSTDTNSFSGPIWDSVDHLKLDVDMYQLPTLHDNRTFLLSTTPITVHSSTTINGVKTVLPDEKLEGANPVPELIGQYIEWKRIDKDTLAESIFYQYEKASAGDAFSQWHQDYGGWRFMLKGFQDQAWVSHTQDGLIMQRRYIVVGGYAHDGLGSLMVKNGADVNTVPGPSITAPTPEWYFPVGLGQYTLIDNSSTPNLPSLVFDHQTNTWNGNPGGGVTGGTIGTKKSDLLVGTGGAQVLKAKEGNDILDGAAGADRLDGGTGFDFASYASAHAKVTVSLKTPATNTGDAMGDTFISIEGVFGSDFDDIITGNDSVNYLAGGLGRDRISGLGGNDELVGGSGNDTLIGGAGRDILTGDSGSDVFDFNAVSETRPGATTRDVINDFTKSVDKIDLRTIDANTKIAGDQPFKYIGPAPFHKVAGELRVNLASGHVYVSGDVNGDGVADFQIDLIRKSSTNVVTNIDFYF